MEINSIEITLNHPQEKKEKIVQQCQDLLISLHKGTKPIN